MAGSRVRAGRRATLSQLEREGASVHYTRVEGSGDPLVLLHGGWEDSRAWYGMTPLLRTGFDLLTYDRRGHGESTVSGPPAAGVDARDLAALLEATDLYPAHVVAQDSGCVVAAELASDRPELVRSLVLHEPVDLALGSPVAGPGPTATVERFRRTLSRCERLAVDGAVEAAAEEYLQTFGAPEERWASFPDTARARWTANGSRWGEERAALQEGVAASLRFADDSTPVLVTTGADSPAGTLELLHHWTARLPNAHAEVLPGAGHLPYLFAPEPLVGAWARYLLERNVPST